MTEYVPECRAHDIPGWLIGDCICDELRAHEQRLAREWVQERSSSDAWMTSRQAALAFDAMERELSGKGCTWAHGDCPNGSRCRECKRMDDLIQEREQGWSEAITRVLEIIEGLPCKCMDSLDYCDGQTDVYTAIERLREDSTDESASA